MHNSHRSQRVSLEKKVTFPKRYPSVIRPPTTLASPLLGAAPLAGIISPTRTASKAGSWTGSWQSTYIAFPVPWNSGPMLLNLAEDPLLGILAGTAVLQGSRYASVPFEVSGVIINEMTPLPWRVFSGFYTLLVTATPVIDEGILPLSLNPPVL